MTNYSLAEGVELCGEYRGSGYVEPRHLVRRGDGRMVELSPLLYSVAATLDGNRAVAEVATAVGASRGRPITAEGIAYLVETKLRPLGVVGTAAGVPPRTTGQPVLGLAMRGAVVPKALVARIAGALRPLFLPPIVAAALLALVTVDTWLLAGHRLSGGINALVLEPALLPFLVGLMVVGGAFHELGHATASRYGGAEPGVIGAGIYLLWPVFYNDLNDSYRLSRAGRLRADLGGVYFNVVFILVLVAVYSLTGYEALLVGVAAQHLAILQQFLPFVRLDGYYVVSDVAGVPNLFGHIRPIMSSWLLRGRRNPVEQPLRRGARVIVTAWVLLTVPLLGACLVLLVVRLPSVVGLGLESARTHLGAFSAAVRDGAVLTGLGSALHLVFLAVMFIGLSFTIARVVRRVLWRPRHGTPPGIVEQATGPEQVAPSQ